MKLNVTVIDGQGGGLGKQLVDAILKADLNINLTAVGTNSLATSAMIKAGAKKVATGENAVIVASRKSDIMVGPLGIAITDSLLGEITPAMATAVGQSSAKKILIPMNLCDLQVVGVPNRSMALHIKDAIDMIRQSAGS